MPLDNLRDFIKAIDRLGELVRVTYPVRARLEVAEIADRFGVSRATVREAVLGLLQAGFNDMVRGLRAVTPAGVLDLGRAPESAAGPDLRQLLIGSEGVFGIITRVRVRVHPVPEATRYEAWSFDDFASGADALRAVEPTYGDWLPATTPPVSSARWSPVRLSYQRGLITHE